MDVRHYAFLARQPSAALKNREHFLGMPKRGLAFILANAMFWQPMWAQADGIVVSAPGTSLGQAGNGVPVVNIAAPNGSGLSHNQFHDYNVGTNGVILNNATGRTQETQLGGIIVGNPNLNGRAANVILNEVNGGSPSQLRGYTEVAGQSAHVIVANPYGISCNGCGFINTPRATLTTGKAVIENGQINRYQVDQGQVTIEGEGINATNVDRFEIITRSAKINAELRANNLTLVAGRNDVDAQTLNATARAADGSAQPQLAIDSSALGGMYAGAIKLVGTEAGVGVKLDGKLIASGGDIQLDANGHLSLADTSAVNGAVNVKANSLDARGPVSAGTALNVQTQGDLSNQQSLAARDSINLSAGGQLTNQGIIEAGVNSDNSRNASGDVSVTAQNLDNSGHSLIASRNLTVTTAQTLTNQGGTLSGQQATKISAATLDNRNKGRVLSSAGLDLSGGQALNAQGLISSDGNLTASFAGFSNSAGTLSSQANITLHLASLDNVAGLVSAGRALDINASALLNNQSGRLAATQDIQLKAGALDNSQQGSIISQGTLGLTASGALDNHQAGKIQSTGRALINSGSLDNHQAGLLSSSNALSLTTGQVNNSESGKITSAMALTASVSGLDQHDKGELSSNTEVSLDLNKGHLDNRGGLIKALGQLLLNNLYTVANQQGEISSSKGFGLIADSLDNTAGKIVSEQALVVRVARALDNTRGLISAAGLDLQAARLDNQGATLNAGDKLELRLGADLDNRGGKIVATDATLNLGQLDNRQAGLLHTRNTADLQIQRLDNRGGEVSSLGSLVFNGRELDNSGEGRLIATGDLTLTLEQLKNQLKGQVSTQGALLLNATQVDNTQGGKIYAKGQLGMTLAGQLLNGHGRLSTDGAFSLVADSLDNTSGKVLGKQSLELRIAQVLLNVQGKVSGKGLDVRAATVDNTQGIFGGDEALALKVKETLNNDRGDVSSAGVSRVTASSLINTQGSVTGDLGLNIELGGLLDNRQGTLGSAGNVTLAAASLDNRDAGHVLSDGRLNARIAGRFDNQGQGEVLVKGASELYTGSLDNRGGSLIGKDLLTLHGDSVDNRGGLIRGDQTLTLRIDALDNREKGLITGKVGIDLAGTRVDNRGGLLSAVGPLTLKAQEVQNALGRIASQSDVQATVDTLEQQGGTLVAQGNLTLSGSVLDNRDDGLVAATKVLKLDVRDIDNRAGKLSSAINAEIDGQQLDNSNGGRVLAGSDLTLKVARLINQSTGLIQGKGITTLSGQSLDNTDGEIDSRNRLQITLAGGFDNTRGQVRSDSTLTLGTSALTNTAGHLASVEGLSITSRGELLNQGGSIKSDQGLTVASTHLDNSQKGLLSGKHATRITATTFNNSQGGRLSSESSLDLVATQVNNADASISSAQDLTASVTGLDQQHGELFSETALSLDLNNGQLNNQGGYIRAPGALLLKNLKGVDNREGEISSAQAFSLVAQSLDNNGARLISDQGLTLRIAQALNNVKGLISARSVDSHSASLDNSDGLLSTTGNLDLKVDSVFDNQRGTVVADGALLLTAASLDNRAADISGKQDVTARIGALNNQGGKLIATSGALDLKGASLDNRQGGLVGATKALELEVDRVDNRGGELSTQAGLSLTGSHLDNSDQGLVEARDRLTLKVDEVINQAAGSINALAGLAITGERVDNRNGQIRSLQGLDLTLKGDLQNNQGLINSQTTLDVASAALDNSYGRLMSAVALNLDARAALTNVGGKLVSEGGVQVRSASLDNSQKGVISGKGAVRITTGDFDNSQTGSLDSGDTLDLTAAKLTNAAGRIGSEKALTANVGSLEQQGGNLFSNTSLSLDLNHGRLDNRDGFIHAPGSLLLKNLSDVDNRNGEISSNATYELNARSLNNDGGQLLGNQALTLRVEQALSSIKGRIGAAALQVQAASLDNSAGAMTSRSGLKLKVQGQLNNQDLGVINAIDGLSIDSGDLNNSHGSVLAGDSLSLSAKALNNTDSGLINSKGTLELTAQQLDSSDDGEVSAKGDMNLKVTGLTQRGGRLLGDGAVTLDLSNGDLDNSLGKLSAKGLLSINQLQDLKNRQGALSSRQGFSLTGRTLDNTQGKLISEAALGLTAGQLLNENGLVSGISGLTVGAGSLDNRNHGTLSSKEGDLAIDLSGALLNSGAGALASNGTLKLTAASLDNSNQGVVSSVGGQTLTVAGLLNNADGGLIDSGATLDLTAATLNNQAGNVGALQSAELRTGSLDNSAGSLATKGVLTLDVAGSLGNVQGTISSDGALLLKRAAHVDNRGGKLIGQSLLTFNADSLDNRDHGTVAANQQATLSVAGAVQNNQGGLIYSRDAGLELKAASLDNTMAAVQSQNGLTLNIGGDFNNQGGKVIGQDGTVSITAANVDNRGGVLSSLKGALETHISGVLQNGYDQNDNRQRGVIEAQRLNLRALAGLNNVGGRIAARDGDVIVNTAGFDNRNGGLYASGLVGVTAATFDNGGDKGGQVGGQGVDLGLSGALNNRLGIIESDTTLAIRAASLDNGQGQLRASGASGKTLFQIGGLLDNRNGRIEVASPDLKLSAASFQNAGGTLLHSGTGQFDISMANVSGAGGTVVTQGGLTLNADSWTNTSVIQAGRLKVNVNNFYQGAGGQLLASNSFEGSGGNWTNDGLIASDGSLNLQLSGAYGGNGRLTSLGDMRLGAAQVDLTGTATIAGGGNTWINVGGALTNRAHLSSAQALTINAGAINNYGSLGSGGALTLNAGTLLNAGVSDPEHSSIFSGGDMQLLGNTFTNRYADVYSMGSLLVAANAGQAQSSLLENRSGTIESLGDMTIRAMTVKNVMDILTYSEHEKYYAAITELSCAPFGVCHVKSHGNRRNAVWQLTERDRLKVDVSTAASSISSGGRLNIGARELSNESSFIASSGDLAINAVSIKNQGVVPQDIETTTIKYNFVDQYQGAVNAVAAFNAKNAAKPSSTLEADLALFNAQMTGGKLPGGGTKNLTGDGKTFDAIIQSGANVQLNASEKIDNGVVRGYYAYVGGSKKTGDTSVGSQYSTPIYINSQLPPDLAKQQVNPLALPGFALPVGQHGLFRLSSEGAGDTTASQRNPAPMDWSMGSSSLRFAEREQNSAQSQARTLQVGSAAPVAATERKVEQVGAVLPGVEVSLPTVAVTAPADSATTTVQLPVHSRIPEAVESGVLPTQPAVPETRVDLGPTPVVTPLVAPVAAVATQTIARVQGVPTPDNTPRAHKYLVETNPVLTNLKQFMSSDYLLSNLGYNPDTSWKRLGDGFYEQRLIQQAVVARTGQRFIDGQDTDEKLFKYLMDNALKSKQQLNLAVGTSLTSEQVAALTHDIVWMETATVNGEQVLVPVLYMAHANNRLASNGALIAGQDVNLIAGKDLLNAGTLRATNNLSAKAGNDLVNSGLIEAGNRLDLLAGNNLVNKAGGIIAGRDVSLTALGGDLINERTVTSHQNSGGDLQQRRDFLDSAARIEAANDLTLKAGRDFTNAGGVLQASRDTTINAGRDANLTAVEQQDSESRTNFLRASTSQHGSVVTSGRDLTINSGRDLSAIASQIDAKRNLAMAATGDLTLASAADEQHSYSSSKKYKGQFDKVSQVATTVTAGGSVALSAGKDLELIASRIKANEDISLDAVQDITIASAQDESSSYYYKKKSGSFGRSSTTKKESYDSTNVASVIEAGHDLTVNTSKDEDGAVSLDGGRNVTIMGSQLKAGNDLVVGATNDVAVLSGVEERGSYSTKTKTGLFGLSKSGNSQLQTNVTQVGSELSAGHDAVVIAGRDVRMHASEINAGNDAELHAGLVDKAGDINLAAADDQAYSRAEEFKKKVGLSLKDTVGLFAGTPGFGADITLSASHKGGREVISSTSVGSQVNAGHDAVLNAARDINIIGSGVSADHNAALDAGRDVNVVAGTNQQRSNSWETNKSYGIKQNVDNNGFTTFVGNETIKHGVESNGHTAAGSFIDAGQNLKVTAGRDINQQGSDLKAENNIKLKAGRDINIDAADETSEVTTRESVKRNGTTTTVAYNLGNTIDSLKGTGKGEDGVSKGSSVLKSVDTLDQFFSGPKFDGHAGLSSTGKTQTQTSVTKRPSSLSAGGDITLEAENDVNVKGSQFDAGRDINVAGRNITFDVAHGAESSDGNQTQSKGGLKGGTTGGFKIGVGVSNVGNKDESNQGTSTPTRLNAGGSINLDAKNDLTLIGTQATAERDIKLKAANDLSILSAQNTSSSEHDRRSWGAEGGLILGKDGFGIYGSANIGIGDLNREGVQQQEAYLYAGNKLDFESGRDTNIAGATLRGDEVSGDVGRNLTVTSVPNTGKVRGQELDLSITGSFYGVSGSVGYGKTTGKTNWVENQTVISGKNKVDIRTEDHTQLDGAVVSADNGNLKLDTNTLGFRNITGKDNEHGYYLNVSGNYGGQGGSQADKPNKGMEAPDKNSWAVEGYNYTKDREQTLNATVGAGEIVVRHDKATGQDSTAGLNRDVNKAYEITKDEEHRTDLYVSSSSIDEVRHPIDTVNRWTDSVVDFRKNQKEQVSQVINAITTTWNDIQAQHVDSSDVPAKVREVFDDERALTITKNLVRAGVDPKVFESLDENVLKALGDFATQATDYDGQLHVLNDSQNGAVNTPPGWRPGDPLPIGDTGVNLLPRNTGEAMLNPLVDALTLAGKLPAEQIQAISLSIQAIMGPLKLAVSLTAKAAINQVLGPKFEEVKEAAAIELAAMLTDRTPKFMKDVHEEAKSNADSVLKGEPYVVAVEFLIDAVLGEVKSLGIKGAGRVLSVRADTGKSQGGMGHSTDTKRGAVFKEAAAQLGYDRRIPPQKAPFDSHGQPVFFNGKEYITPDVDGHNVTGGWKVFDRKGRRVGTYDENLNRIKK